MSLLNVSKPEPSRAKFDIQFENLGKKCHFLTPTGYTEL